MLVGHSRCFSITYRTMYFAYAAAIGLFSALTNGYPAPGPCSGSCYIHDPALVRRESDGVYFRFSTGNKISYASAPSIEGPWTDIGSMLPGGSKIPLPGNDDLWVRPLPTTNAVLIASRRQTRISPTETTMCTTLCRRSDRRTPPSDSQRPTPWMPAPGLITAR